MGDCFPRTQDARGTEAQQALQDLHWTCSELVAVPCVIQSIHASMGSDEEEPDALDAVAISQLTGMSTWEERKKRLRRLSAMPQLQVCAPARHATSQ